MMSTAISRRALALGNLIQVISHSADYDGQFSRAVFERMEEMDVRTPDEGRARFIHTPWDFNDPTPEIDPSATAVIVVDLPFDVNASLVGDARLVWIDHHQSSIARVPSHVAGYWIDGVAACRLAWQYVFGPDDLPTKEHYEDRCVLEPLAIRLAGEYDVWNRTDPRAEQFQYGLTINGGDGLTRYLLDVGHQESTALVCRDGKAAQAWHRMFADETSRQKSYHVRFEGLNFLALCSCHARSSLWFHDDLSSCVDALMTWRVGPNDTVHLSLYHAPGHEEIDLSVIALKYGGGGHKGACGFTMSWVDAMCLLIPPADPGSPNIGMIHMGNGDHTEAQVAALHEELDEILRLLSGLQQPDDPCLPPDKSWRLEAESEYARLMAGFLSKFPVSRRAPLPS